jgi:hypothetical protein
MAGIRRENHFGCVTVGLEFESPQKFSYSQSQ